MTPKEKAQGLWLEYYELLPDGIYSTQAAKIEAKKYALIAVKLRLDGHFPFTSIEYGLDSLEYWEAVKTEIKKL
jgi:hypothetical protein